MRALKELEERLGEWGQEETLGAEDGPPTGYAGAADPSPQKLVTSSQLVFVRLVFRTAHSLEDAIHEILTEIRACPNILGLDVDLVQVLEPEDVAVAQFGYDAAEEEAKFIQARPSVLHGQVGER